MTPLKKQISALLILGVVVFSACKASETAPIDSASLRMHQSTRLASGVAVQVDSIQDSRCPQGVNCVWAGQAKVDIVLSAQTDSSRVHLTLEPGVREDSKKRLDSTHVSLNSETYKVILREVNPYPNTDNLGQPKTAVVQVTKL